MSPSLARVIAGALGVGLFAIGIAQDHDRSPLSISVAVVVTIGVAIATVVGAGAAFKRLEGVPQALQRSLIVAAILVGLALSALTDHAAMGFFAVLAGLCVGFAIATAVAARREGAR